MTSPEVPVSAASSSDELVVRLITNLLPMKSLLGGRGVGGDCGEEAAGLTPRHMLVLMELLVRGPMSVSALAATAGSNLASISLAASQLEAAGMVLREEDPLDHRRTIVRITERGREVARSFLATRAAPLANAMARLKPGRAELLVELLGEVADAVRAEMALSRPSSSKPKQPEPLG